MIQFGKNKRSEWPGIGTSDVTDGRKLAGIESDMFSAVAAFRKIKKLFQCCPRDQHDTHKKVA